MRKVFFYEDAVFVLFPLLLLVGCIYATYQALNSGKIDALEPPLVEVVRGHQFDQRCRDGMEA